MAIRTAKTVYGEEAKDPECQPDLPHMEDHQTPESTPKLLYILACIQTHVTYVQSNPVNPTQAVAKKIVRLMNMSD